MGDLQDLLVEQEQLFASIRRIVLVLTDTSTLTSAKAAVRLDHLQAVWQKCEDSNVRIHQAVSTEEDRACSYFTEAQFNTIEDIFLDAVSDVKQYLFGSPGQPTSSAAAPTSRPSEPRRPMQVPLIKLPRFSGVYTDWPEFRDYFSSLFISDKSFDNLQRLHYLKACLDGEAEQLIKHLSTTEANFDIAWRTLSDRYSNKRRLVAMHLNTFFSIKPVHREGSPTELRKLLDTAKQAIEALNSANRPLNDDTIIFTLLQRVDKDTREAWELRFSETAEFPTFIDFENFLNTRIRAFEAAAPLPNRGLSHSSGASKSKPTLSPIQTHMATSSQAPCPLCREQHSLHKCKTFLAAPTPRRWELAKQTKACFNCLTTLHFGKSCSSKRGCALCGRRHHSTLHHDVGALGIRTEGVSPSASNASAAVVDTPRIDTSLVQTHFMSSSAQVVLATAWVLVSSPSKRVVKVRALLDQGSTHTFVSQSLVNALKTKTYPASAVVSGIGQSRAGPIDRIVPITLTPTQGTDPGFSTEALILNSLTEYVPRFRFPLAHWKHLHGLNLADERPTDDTPIHAIIGADLYAYVLRDGIRRGLAGEPVAQNTAFGWVISGHTDAGRVAGVTEPVHIHHVQVYHDLNDALRRFWEVEEVSVKLPPSEDDAKCEMHFRTTHSRASDGRYVVRIPMRHDPSTDLGDTQVRAEQCLLALEKRFRNRPTEREAYSAFLQEYEALGHMREAPNRARSTRPIYLPHHSVVKTTTSTSKIRVVFNASATSTNGRSFNDCQLTGPKLQSDLPLLHSQWRSHQFVLCADIEKMYRQILVDERDVDLQRILWRKNPAEAIKSYQLLTVTYGSASSPFLALRVLRQLAEDDGDAFPLAKRVLEKNMYVDDALFGADTLTAAKQLRDQLIALLNRGHFQLRKLASNSPTLLHDIDVRHHSLSPVKPVIEDDSLKVLGIIWQPSYDSYRFVVRYELQTTITKRVVLSTIARLYDPLGWLSPVVIVAKIFLQALWKIQVDWDTPLPENLCRDWHLFHSALPSVNDIVIPRWIGLKPESLRRELHGFSDASTTAYAAVIYFCTSYSDDDVTVSLIISKTKVAPIKQLTVPRLELCGAVLLARLMAQIRLLPAFTDCDVYCWTDATIVLAWLSAQSSKWKTFVAHRVAEIHTLLPEISWRHVPGYQNPADLGSRGLKATDITRCELWWHGPPWLTQIADSWPTTNPATPDDALVEQKVYTATVMVVTPVDDLFTRFSSWPRMLRVIALMLRWSPHWLHRRTDTTSTTADADELAHVSTRILSITQFRHFRREIELLRNNEPASDGFRRLGIDQALYRGSPLRRLNPVIDRRDLLCVGGRLSLSQLAPAAKFPVILNNGPLARLLVADAHQRCLHGNISLTLSTLRNSIWVLQARKTVKSVIFHCIACARIKAEIPRQLMGSLPPVRVDRPCRPFSECGIDYAGPVSVRMAGGRGARAQSAYIAVFVCMATKAVHLEIVTAYTTSAFLAALQRFSSRRGVPHVIHSDRGTNFQGADKELSKAFRAIVVDPEFKAHIATDAIRWNFIPPAAPHFGGLWEAGVKAMKHHLKRVLGAHTPTFEELATLLCRVEACMNSRPLGPLHDDPESLDVLTPAHFLVGGPLAAIPLPSLLDASTNRLSRWQAIQQMLEQFWQQWSRDYIQSCQHRTKWLTKTAPLEVGQIVLLRNENLPPTKWNLGRIVKCHPGHDGLVRVVSVKTASSQFVRPITKLALLPICLDAAK